MVFVTRQAGQSKDEDKLSLVRIARWCAMQITLDWYLKIRLLRYPTICHSLYLGIATLSTGFKVRTICVTI